MAPGQDAPDEHPDPVDPGEAARALGAVLDAIDRGEIEATDVQRAYLAGAGAALAQLAVDE